ncbi:hypothetical protein, partial [Methylobacterium sp. J-070]|uniref:hypothetical protein n=1 Tax=Methylobacterium sp. J-070 TaxID=2836650 RepID=UPI001FBB0F62
AGRQMGPAETALRASCTADYRRLCPESGDDTSAVEACFRRKIGQISPGCQDAAAEFGEQAKAERATRR